MLATSILDLEPFTDGRRAHRSSDLFLKWIYLYLHSCLWGDCEGFLHCQCEMKKKTSGQNTLRPPPFHPRLSPFAQHAKRSTMALFSLHMLAFGGQITVIYEAISTPPPPQLHIQYTVETTLSTEGCHKAVWEKRTEVDVPGYDAGGTMRERRSMQSKL